MEDEDFKGRLETPADAQRFVFAGKAIITLRSRKSGDRFTYRITKKEEDGKDDVWFVNVLTGPENTSDYTYLGLLTSRGFFHDKQNRVSREAPSAIAWGFFLTQLDGLSFHPALEVWHEGRCCRCGRTLTVPQSIKLGIGPECASKMGVELECEELPLEGGATKPKPKKEPSYARFIRGNADTVNLPLKRERLPLKRGRTF